jgi:hypothetical protein
MDSIEAESKVLEALARKELRHQFDGKPTNVPFDDPILLAAATRLAKRKWIIEASMVEPTPRHFQLLDDGRAELRRCGGGL